VWIADANAHGKRYCGRLNHQDEEPKLEPQIKALIDRQMKFQGFSLRGGANTTFTEMQQIYEQANPALFFKFQDFNPGNGPVDAQAKTVGEVVSATLETCVHEFIDRPTDAQPRRVPLGATGDGKRVRAVTFSLPG
jgi:hypothetical protein